MSRVLVAAAAIAIVSGGLVFAMTRAKDDPLVAEIERAAKLRRSGSAAVPVRLEAAGDDWDRMVVLAPYTTTEEAGAAAGIPVSARSMHHLDRRDDIVVVLRVGRGKLVGTTPIRRQVADLLPLTTGGSLDQSTSVVADFRDPPSAVPEVVVRRR